MMNNDDEPNRYLLSSDKNKQDFDFFGEQKIKDKNANTYKMKCY